MKVNRFLFEDNQRTDEHTITINQPPIRPRAELIIEVMKRQNLLLKEKLEKTKEKFNKIKTFNEKLKKNVQAMDFQRSNIAVINHGIKKSINRIKAANDILKLKHQVIQLKLQLLRTMGRSV